MRIFPAAQGVKRPDQSFFRHFQQVQLPQQPPFLRAFRRFQGRLARRRGSVPGLPGKIDEIHPGLNLAAVVISAFQQAEKGCFAPSIAADQPQFPLGVQLEVYVFKHIVRASIVAEGQVLYGNQRH